MVSFLSQGQEAKQLACHVGGLGLDARWRQETQLYDRRLLMERVQHLRAVKKSGDVHEMMFAVRADLLRNLGNMCNR